MKTLKGKIKYSKRLKKIIIFTVTFILLYIVLFSAVVTEKYNLKEGDIAKKNIKASREIEDKYETEANIQKAQESVDPQYHRKVEVKKDALDSVDVLFQQIKSLKDSNNLSGDNIKNSLQGISIDITDSEVIALTKIEEGDFQELKKLLKKTTETVFENNIRENSSEDIKKVEDIIIIQLNNSKFNKEIRDISLKVLRQLVKPNFFYDKEKTEALKTEQAKKVPKVMIKKDQIIVKEGEPVSKREIQILSDLGLLNTSPTSNWYVYVNLAVLVVVILSIQWFFLYKFKNKLYEDISKLILISILDLIAILLARVLNQVPFLIPLACVPMLLTLLLGYQVAIIISALNAILMCSVVGFNAEILLVAMLNAILGPIFLKKMQQRNDILYSSLYIAVINSIMTFSVGFIISNNLLDILKKSGFVFIGSSLSAILTIGFLPFFESIFDIVTTIKLLELSNPNHPLLKRLLLEAPGTYHHSILVANLAEVAAEDVGANPVLARVSAYYHDIGKIKRPYFFKENQIGNDNPHDKISPNLSSLIIIAHVKEGLEMAREYKVPKVIRDAIIQHHGTDLVKYFYITMKNSSENPDEVKEENFRYPGPKPRSKEVAILMLADGVEAAVRSISEPTKGKIEEMVNNIIKSRLNSGQLEYCDLTLNDIEKIRRSFLKALLGIYHNRIEYPKDKWEKVQKQLKIQKGE